MRRITALEIMHLPYPDASGFTAGAAKKKINPGTKWIGDDDRRSPRQAFAGNPAISSFDHSRPEALRPRLAAGLPHARNCYSRLTVLGIRAGLTHCNSSQCTDMRLARMSRITDISARRAPDDVESSWQREPTESIGNFAAG
jgi:hypothetical protein